MPENIWVDLPGLDSTELVVTRFGASAWTFSAGRIVLFDGSVNSSLDSLRSIAGLEILGAARVGGCPIPFFRDERCLGIARHPHALAEAYPQLDDRFVLHVASLDEESIRAALRARGGSYREHAFIGFLLPDPSHLYLRICTDDVPPGARITLGPKCPLAAEVRGWGGAPHERRDGEDP